MPGWTPPETWVEAEVITDSKLNTNIRDNTLHLQEWLGELDYDDHTADVTGITTTPATIATINPDIPEGGRSIKVVVELHVESSVAGDEVEIRIDEGGTLALARVVIAAANKEQFVHLERRLSAPASGVHTYNLIVVRASGTGNVIVRAGATFPAFILAEGL